MTREEAINILRETHDNAPFSVRTALETLAPELEEDKEERMLRETIRYVKEQGDKPTGLPNGTATVADMVDFLEELKLSKPRWKIMSPHTTKWTWEMINEKFDELCGLERPGEREADNETEVRKACDHNTGEKIRESSGWIITPHKEFFKWIYERLIHVHKENPNVDYMRSLKERIDNMPSDEPQWKPTDSHLRFLRAVVNDPKNAGAESCHIALKSLLEELEKL